MKVRFAPRALSEAKRIKYGWLTHRPAAADLFDREMAAAVEQIGATPDAGTPYPVQGAPTARRLLLPKSRNHLYNP